MPNFLLKKSGQCSCRCNQYLNALGYCPYSLFQRGKSTFDEKRVSLIFLQFTLLKASSCHYVVAVFPSSSHRNFLFPQILLLSPFFFFFVRFFFFSPLFFFPPFSVGNALFSFVLFRYLFITRCLCVPCAHTYF